MMFWACGAIVLDAERVRMYEVLGRDFDKEVRPALNRLNLRYRIDEVRWGGGYNGRLLPPTADMGILVDVHRRVCRQYAIIPYILQPGGEEGITEYEPKGLDTSKAAFHETSAPAMVWREIAASHLGKWILMQVTGRDEVGTPYGHVIAVSDNREEVSVQLHKRLDDKEAGHGLFLFFGNEYLDSGPELERAAQAFVTAFRRSRR